MKEQVGPPGGSAAAQPGRRPDSPLGSPLFCPERRQRLCLHPTLFSMPLPWHDRQILGMGRPHGELPLRS